MIITFYSFKGGVGRTQLVANLASYLCHHKDKKILMIDWDLESPGLHRYFWKDFNFKKGLIDFLGDFCIEMRNGKNVNIESLPSIETHPELYITNLRSSDNKVGKIDILPGGGYSKDSFVEYFGSLSEFNWFEFYELLDGNRFIEVFKDQLRQLDYDYIFIDSRTGFGDYQGICNIQMPDMNIKIAAPSHQNFDGCKEAIDRILKSPYTTGFKKSPTIILPILSRLDRTDNESGVWFRLFREEFFKTILSLFKYLAPSINFDKLQNNELEELKNEYIECTLLEYKTHISFGEQLLFSDPEEKIEPTSLEKQFQEIAEIIEEIKASLNHTNKKAAPDKAKSQLADILRHRFTPLPKALTSIPNLEVEIIFGREEDLKNLHRSLKSAKAPILINGPEGSGKTLLAKFYIDEYKEEYDHIVWIPVKTEKQSIRQAILEAFIDSDGLLGRLGVEIDHKDRADIRLKKILKAVLSLSGNNLWVIDNVQKFTEKTSALLPQQNNWKILLTSRQDLPEVETHTLKIILTKEASNTLFSKFYKKEADQEEVEELLKLVEYNPMIIEKFAKDLQRDFTLNISDLIEQVKTAQKKSLESSPKEEENGQGQTFLNFLAAFDTTDLEPGEREILLNFSILPAEEIDGPKLLQLFRVPSDRKEQRAFIDTIDQLVHKRWLNHNERNRSFKCHPAIQDVARYQLKPDFSSCRPLIELIAEQIALNEKNNLIEKRPWMVFAQRILDYIDEEVQTIAEMWINLGILHRDLANYPQAVECSENALKILGKLNDDDLLQKAILNLVQIYQDLGEHEEARKRLESDLESTKQKFGKDSPRLLPRQIGLSRVYKELGEPRKAISLLENAEQIAIAESGSQASVIIEIKMELAIHFLESKRYDKAEQVLTSALSLAIETSGENSPTAANIHKELANLYIQYNKEEEAGHHLDQAIKINEEYGKEQSFEDIDEKISLATVCFDAQNYDGARDLLETALNYYLQAQSESHPKIMQIQLKLVNIYIAKGDIKTAIQWMRSILKIEEDLYGKDSKEIVKNNANLAELFIRDEQYDAAEKMLNKVVKAYEKEHDNNIEKRKKIAEARAGLAKVYQKLGDYAKAEEWLNRAIELNWEIFKTAHPRIARNYREMGHLYQALAYGSSKDDKKFIAYQKKALAEFKKAMKIFKDKLPQQPGHEHPEIESLNERIEFIKTAIKYSR